MKRTVITAIRTNSGVTTAPASAWTRDATVLPTVPSRRTRRAVVSEILGGLFENYEKKMVCTKPAKKLLLPYNNCLRHMSATPCIIRCKSDKVLVVAGYYSEMLTLRPPSKHK